MSHDEHGPGWEWRDHTSELELRVWGTTEEEIFQNSVHAFRNLVETAPEGEVVSFDVEAEGSDRATQLAAWLNELIFLAETESFVPDEAHRVRLRRGRVEAVLEGRRSPVRPIAKAATYHRLSLKPAELRTAPGKTEHGWEARVVVDV